ncbi:MAG: serine hydrolase domain-containing protein [Acidobacteriota bacterium]
MNDASEKGNGKFADTAPVPESTRRSAVALARREFMTAATAAGVAVATGMPFAARAETTPAPVAAKTENNPLEKFLSVPGATITKPVSVGKQSFSKEYVVGAHQRFNNFHMQMGGDDALYYGLHMPEFLPTAMSMPNVKYKPLEYKLDARVGALKQKTDSKGELTLDQYVKDPTFRHQGVVMVHKGKVIFEAYPGMNPTDVHFWASSGKTTVGLVMAQMAEEGKFKEKEPITTYVPALKGTAWDNDSVLDVLNHTGALDIEETGATILNPNSEFVRLVSAGFGATNPATGKIDDPVAVLREVKPLKNEKPGEINRYSSLNTYVLTMMIENIEGKPWAAVFQERVWSKVNGRMPLMFAVDPTSRALPFGLTSSALPDMARFAALFTPSWKAVSEEQIVTPKMLKRIRAAGSPEAFAKGDKYNSTSFGGEKALTMGYHFDFIFADGGMYKGGNLNQCLYADPERDFAAVCFSAGTPTTENKMPAYMRKAAKLLAGK